MDGREKDTREKIETLAAALAGQATAEQMYELHRVAEVALDFRRSDEIAGLPPVDEALVDELRAASFRIGYEMHDGPDATDAVAVAAWTRMATYDLAAERPRRLTPGERAFLGRWAAA